MHDAHTHTMHCMACLCGFLLRNASFMTFGCLIWLTSLVGTPMHHSSPACIFDFFASSTVCHRICSFFACYMHFNENVPFFLVNILCRYFESLASCILHRIVDVHFSLVIIYAIHDMHQRNNRQTEKLQWRRFDDIFSHFFLSHFWNALCNWHIAVMNWKSMNRNACNMHEMWIKNMKALK